MQNRRQRLNLPFVKRRTDPVTWIYEHRAGVFSLIALTLAMAILFIGSRIVVRTPLPSDAILVDIQTIEELREEAQRLERENRLLQSQAIAGEVRNIVSNEGAELRDDRNTDMSGMRGQLSDANERMRGNREAYDRSLREIEQMTGPERAEGKRNSGSDARAAGTVQVSFSLVNPLRHAVDLVNPGYRCERDGTVVVQIAVDRGGNVVAAAVDKGASTADDCMHSTALDAARRSLFDVNTSAPERHTGTITYRFIRQ